MIKKASIFVIIFTILLTGVYFYNRTPQPTPTSAPVATESNLPKDTQRYVTFSPESLATAKTTRRVLFFYANWCPTCRPADTSFDQNQDKIPADVTVIRVNYNDTETDSAEKELARKYTVTYQHTYVQIDSQGKEVTKWNGGKLEELLKNIK